MTHTISGFFVMIVLPQRYNAEKSRWSRNLVEIP